MATDDASSAEMPRPPDPGADPLALDDDTVERLLRGTLPPAQTPPGYAKVAQLLAATVAAPSSEELAGQGAVLAELRAVTRARPPTATTTSRAASSPRRRRRAGLAVVVVVGALVTGGVAGAATGHLPGPVRAAARSILDAADGGTPPASTQAGQPPAPVKRPAGSGGGLGSHRRRPGPRAGPCGALPGVHRRQRRRAGRQARRHRLRGAGQSGRGRGQGRGLVPGPPWRRPGTQEAQAEDTKPKKPKQPGPAETGNPHAAGAALLRSPLPTHHH